jgi:hypothetical protein
MDLGLFCVKNSYMPVQDGGFSVASRPKILQQNSKKFCREKLAAVRPPFFGKSGRKPAEKFCWGKKLVFK